MLDDGGEVARGLQEVATIGGAGIIGRLVWALRQSQAGKRAFFSMATLIDMLIAVPSAYVGLALWEVGLAMHLINGGLPGHVLAAWLGIAGYLGPYAVDSVLAAIVKRIGTK